jgi:Mrp family chromosome partitioning ATPase/capsular polysaccharide biosynthesis protein
MGEKSLRGEDETGRSGDVGALLAHVRNYWWLVVAVVVVAVVGAFAATAMTPTTYVGRTSLIVSSNDRSPDQDAVLVQGYVDYFNDTAYQEQLLATVGAREDVSLSASSSASSPILVISATTSDPKTAQSNAVQVASAFADDINDVHTTKNAERLAQLRQQLTEALNSDSDDAQSVIDNVQDQIDMVQSDTVNTLQELQSKGGVAELRPSLFGNLVPAAGGGLLLGVLAAVTLSRLSRRIHGSLDVRDKVGVPTLVSLPRPKGGAGRARQENRLGQLANIVRARLAGPGIVAVAQPEQGYASSVVARELALEWARQGYPTVLVNTRSPASPAEERLDGTPDGVLDGGQATPMLRPGGVAGLSILELTPETGGPGPAATVSTASEFVARQVLAGQYVIFEAPAVVQSAAAQATCLAADHTVLVVDPEVTRVPAAREAIAVLRQMGAHVLGVVVAAVRRDQGEEALLTAAPASVDAPGKRPKAVAPAQA